MKNSKRIIRTGLSNLARSFKESTQDGYADYKNALARLGMGRKCRIAFNTAAGGAIAAGMILNPSMTLALTGLGIIYKASTAKKNSNINACLCAGSMAVTGHLALASEWPGALNTSLGVLRTGTLNAIGSASRGARIITASAAFGIASGVYLTCMPITHGIDYVPLGTIGMAAAGNAFPDNKTHWARPLYIGMNMIMGSYYISKAYMGNGGSYPIGAFHIFMALRYANSLRKSGDIKLLKNDIFRSKDLPDVTEEEKPALKL
jgi:hypothetical protein